jgi:hypothetical protein
MMGLRTMAKFRFTLNTPQTITAFYACSNQRGSCSRVRMI